MKRPATRACPWPDVRQRSALLATSLLLVAGMTLAGCGSDKKESKPAPHPSSAAPTAAAPVRTQTQIKHVVGSLPAGARKRVATRIGSAVDAWFRAAYVGGSYPRAATTFKNAFPGFTPGAVATARKRLDVMSNASIAPRVDEVSPVTELVALDIIAAKGKAVGVTARIKLVYRTTGQVTAREAVRGQLDLTPATGKWRVFAFDVTRRQTTQKAGGKG